MSISGDRVQALQAISRAPPPPRESALAWIPVQPPEAQNTVTWPPCPGPVLCGPQASDWDPRLHQLALPLSLGSRGGAGVGMALVRPGHGASGRSPEDPKTPAGLHLRCAVGDSARRRKTLGPGAPEGGSAFFRPFSFGYFWVFFSVSRLVCVSFELSVWICVRMSSLSRHLSPATPEESRQAGRESAPAPATTQLPCQPLPSRRLVWTVARPGQTDVHPGG